MNSLFSYSPASAKTKMATLDSAGFSFSPFTVNDIWGGPTPLALKGTLNKEILLGADDSPMRQMTDPGLNQGAPIMPSSGARIPHVPHAFEINQAMVTQNKTFYFVLFGLILAGAFYFRVPGGK